jgi:hypothetical protein
VSVNHVITWTCDVPGCPSTVVTNGDVEHTPPPGWRWTTQGAIRDICPAHPEQETT